MIKINGKELTSILEAISKTNTSSKNETDNEELNTIKMVGSNNALQLIATSSGVDIAYKIDVLSMNNPLSATLNNKDLAKKLSVIIDNDGNLTLDSTNNGVVVSGNGTITLALAEPKKKVFPTVNKKPIASFIASDLEKAISCVVLAKGKSGIVSKIKVSINTEDPSLKLLGFNKTLMCSYNIPLEDVNDDEKSIDFLVDGESLKNISTTLSLIKNEIVDLIVLDNKIVFSSENLKIILPMSKEEFVKCESLLNETFSTNVTFNIKAIKKSINAIYKVSKGNVKFESDGNSHMFSTKGFSQPAQVVNSTPISFSLPITIIKDIIGKIYDTNIVFETSDRGVIKISPETSDDVIFITAGCK